MSPDNSSQSTQELLLLAAKKLFAKNGFDGTSVKDLADHAGVNVSLVSYHFGGKEGLYRTCLEQFGKERLAVAQRLLQPDLPLKSTAELRIRLEMMVEEVFRCHIDEPELTSIIHRECGNEKSIAEDIFRETFMKSFETMVIFMKGAQKRGLIREELDPMIMTAVFHGSIIHIASRAHLAEKHMGLSLKEPKYRKKMVDHLISIFLEGVSP